MGTGGEREKPKGVMIIRRDKVMHMVGLLGRERRPGMYTFGNGLDCYMLHAGVDTSSKVSDSLRVAFWCSWKRGPKTYGVQH